MDWNDFIAYAVIGIITATLMQFLDQSANQKVLPDQDGKTRLKLGRFYQILGNICVGMVALFVIAAIYYSDEELYFTATIIFFLMGGLGVALLLYYYNHRLIFDEREIIGFNWLGKKTSMRWNAIKQVKFHPISGYLKVKSADQTIKIHKHLIGLKSFIEEMEMQTDWKAEKLRLPF